MNQDDQLHSSENAAKLLGMSASTLAKLRLRGEGPTFVKMGRRLVFYRCADLIEWIHRHRFTSTSQYTSS